MTAADFRCPVCHAEPGRRCRRAYRDRQWAGDYHVDRWVKKRCYVIEEEPV